MDGKIIAYVVAALAGAAMAVQGSMNSALSKAIGLAKTTLIVHIVGTIGAALFVLFSKEKGSELQGPWYYYLGGLIGVVIVYAVAFAMPKGGVAAATTAIVAAQLLTAGIIDRLGIFNLAKTPFSWQTILGAVFIITGAWLVLKE
ncbi:hypothetical protein ciss_10770 [Carboxydothermus islandicus]|uniref:EamA-like transporter family protein n=1 Tax=Carboxydothermus islandicus TaxID=661089 RepID=A0A1L8D1Z8_9THEO|nr:DMT family transporter [Carboxydothermus islandicus]GAV25144.1 hypothetical protein ciss_10770 [Carboxydothermus islandicus]